MIQTQNIKLGIDWIIVGDNMREAREENGWSRTKLAEKTGISPQTIERYECYGPMNLDYAWRISRALGITLDQLIGE